MRRKWNPGCPCCDDVCKIDRFAAETAVSAEVIRSAEHPQSPYPAWLQAEIKVSVGDTIKLLLAWDDTTPGDGLYVEFTPADGETSGTLKLFRKGGTQLGDTLQLICAAPDVWHRITLCYDPDTDEFTACFDARDTRGFILRGLCMSADAPNDFAAGRQAGYGREGGGDVAIRNYKYDRLWYYGTTGLETLCCKPSIATTQTGRYPGSGPVACFDLSAITSPLHDWTLAVMLPDGSHKTVTFHGPHSAAEVCSVLYSVVANEGYPGASYACNFAGDILCVEVGGDFAGEAIPTLEYPNAAVAVYDGDITSVSYTPGTENGVNARQTITLGRQMPCPFFLAFEDEQTAELSEESSAADIQTALEALAPIGAGNVTVTGDVGGPFTVEFVGTLAAQPIGQLVAISSVDDCLDCGPYYGDYGDYGSCPQTTCHHCGGGCTIVDEDFSDLPDGDMPCGWDADGTNWEVIDGAATGDGQICHEFDTTDGSYIVTATFGLGHLETQGDAVTVSLTYGDTTHSLTVTRVAGENPGDPDRLQYSYVPSDMAAFYVVLNDGNATLEICPYHICNNTVQTIVENVVTPGAVCVSITQPTMSGHVDATLTGLTITKSKEMDDNCPECGCTTTCEDYCKDSIWPSGWMVEVEGLESFCCDASGINRAYYATKYEESCHSYGFGDDGEGTCDFMDSGINPLAGPNGEINQCWSGKTGAYLNTTWLVKSNCDWDDYDPGGTVINFAYVHNVYCRSPAASVRETVDGQTVYHPVRVDVELSESLEPGYTHEITVTLTRLTMRVLPVAPYANGCAIASSWDFRLITVVYKKRYSEITDCKNLTDEEIPFYSYDEYGNNLDGGYIDYPICSGLGTPPFAFPPGGSAGQAYVYGTGGAIGNSSSSIKLTAL